MNCWHVGDTLTIDGANVITISGGGTTKIFSVSSNQTFTLQNATVANGKAGSTGGGGLQLGSGTVNLINTTFSNNHADVIFTPGWWWR